MKRTLILAGLCATGLNVAMVLPAHADSCEGVTDHAECEVRLKSREAGHETREKAHEAHEKAAEKTGGVKDWGHRTGQTLDRWGHNTKGDMSQFFTGHR
ncbi:hypothetical protein CFR78_14005 [Komagataeibacter rhaeticus]|uniref:Uncharacterized protein n=1 Tax=Komagataeibacter rhaeticus TaxID=215221 RepID=A0A181CBG0_9PROT|nr:hypothetical protein [Komagataeibacter rhaeticus]ATU72439.1 hypothetical protein CT154_05915 [Komagataeibacter xylinus]EGG74746.1 hypothetical protein SXCC_04471 [Gluconacetobacter sp. SXCC-1]KDU97001.1 hypothetical protein GLUCORHAEAF1_17550 [Komagataeibacter rhaeticus AF1]MBL7238788.1 hypothetical protein [Komagataeibacter rhaeticus]PYD52560.1 hypothetical protein CFR78_14005 [Komagataeibacter rhaeticus]